VIDPRAEEEYGRVTDRATLEELRALTAGLDRRQRKIVEWHYGLRGPTQTLRQIANRLELSVERVRQLEVKALAKIGEAATVAAIPPTSAPG
jgi:RNA polymerase sigma factor (sigma-70 family)